MFDLELYTKRVKYSEQEQAPMSWMWEGIDRQGKLQLVKEDMTDSQIGSDMMNQWAIGLIFWVAFLFDGGGNNLSMKN